MANKDHNIQFIKSICLSLSPPEHLKVVKFLRTSEGMKPDNQVAASGDKVKEKNVKGALSIDFYTTIYNNRQTGSDEKLNSQLNKRFNASQRRNLASRLLRKLHDFMLLDYSLDKIKAPDVLKVQQLLTRNIALCEILLNKRLFHEFNFFSEKMLVLAEKYELYYESCLLLKLIIKFELNRVNHRKFMKLKQKYDERRALADKIFDADMYVTSIKMRSNERITPDRIDELETVLAHMALDEKSIVCNSWWSHYLQIKIDYFQMRREYKEGRELCHKIIEIFENSLIATDVMKGSGYIQLANNYLLEHDFNNAIKYFNLTEKYFKRGLLNHISALEVLFLAKFHSSDYPAAFEIIDLVKTFPALYNNHINPAKWEYFRSTALFMSGEYKQAYMNLHNSSKLYEDKEGWGIGLRILTIMVLIKRELFSMAESEIDNLRRQVSKIKLSQLVTKRTLLICRLFYQLPRFDYNWKKVCDSNSKEMNLLESDSIDLGWHARSSELIRMDKVVF
jgi:hypothetical protein